MAFARPATDCSTFTGRPHLGPSPIYAGLTDDYLSGQVDLMLAGALACDTGAGMRQRRAMLAHADRMLTERAERALWPPHVAAADDAIEQHLERMAGL